MCGRYAASADPDELIEIFEVDVNGLGDPSRSLLVNPQAPPVGSPDFNMAPNKQALVVLERRGRDDQADQVQRHLRPLTWGLAPSWAKDVKIGVRMTNARSETLFDKPAFRKAATSRRALIPADGWYEWQVSPVATDAKGKPRKQPFFMSRADGALTAFAGLYEFWRDPSAVDGDPGAWLTTFTIITTAAEPGLEQIHDRQPVVLDPSTWDAWLDPSLVSPGAVRDLLHSGDPGRFQTWAVSTAVNSNRNNGEALLTPIDESEFKGVVNPATGEIIG
ncbi:SOS response-associated peptidase [Ornithinimicrobium sp. Arc0846-15]|nr:SOS response-associated peptidase [Ornithinimicrobium laminariae]